MAFPSSPTNGQIYKNYKYNSSLGAWEVVPFSDNGDLVLEPETGGSILDGISNSPIIESGSNSNGSWIKYYDGIMIQYGIKSSAILLNTIQNYNIGTYGWSYYYGEDTIIFPIEFYNTSYILFITSYSQGTSSRTVANKSTTSQSYIVFGSEDTEYANVEWITIGRWK